MSARRRVAALLGCALALLGVPAPAGAAPTATLTVSAEHRSAYAEVTFAKAVTLHEMRTTTLSGPGSYLGYYVQPATNPERGWGQVRFAEFETRDWGNEPIPLGQARPAALIGTPPAYRLPAGRYRIHVLSDAPAVLRLALSGGGVRSRRLVATHASVASGAAKEIARTTVPGGAPAAALGELPVIAHGRTIAFAAAFVVERWEGVHVGNLPPCIRPPGEPHCVLPHQWSGQYHSMGGTFAPPFPGLYSAWTYVESYSPGQLPSGELVAYADVASPHRVERIAMAAFTLSL